MDLYNKIIPDESNKINDDVALIYFSDDLFEIFNKRIISEKLEFGYCLKGIKQKGDNSFFVNEITESSVMGRTEGSITQICSKEAMLYMHSHPDSACYLSSADKKSLDSSSLDYMCAMCDVNKIGCFDRNDKRLLIGGIDK